MVGRSTVEERWYDENRGYVINDRNIYNTRIKASEDIKQERLAPVIREWEQQLEQIAAARAAARAAAVGPVEGPASEDQTKWQALIDRLSAELPNVVDDIYMTSAINKAISEAQKSIDNGEPYPNFESDNDENSNINLHINTIYMYEKINQLNVTIKKSIFVDTQRRLEMILIIYYLK